MTDKSLHFHIENDPSLSGRGSAGHFGSERARHATGVPDAEPPETVHGVPVESYRNMQATLEGARDKKAGVENDGELRHLKGYGRYIARLAVWARKNGDPAPYRAAKGPKPRH